MNTGKKLKQSEMEKLFAIYYQVLKENNALKQVENKELLIIFSKYGFKPHNFEKEINEQKQKLHDSVENFKKLTFESNNS